MARSRRRANHEGTVYFVRGERRWRAAASWTDADGRQRRRTFSAATQATALSKLTAFRAELQTVAQSPAFMSHVLDKWLAAQRTRVRPSTWRQREQIVRLYLGPTIGQLRLSELDVVDVERMGDRLLARGLSARTTAHARAVLRCALADAQRHGLITRNVAQLARPPHVPQSTPRYLSAERLRSVIGIAGSDRYGSAIVLAACTGLRQGEVLGLAWQDLDLERRWLSVRQSLARGWTDWELAEPKSSRSRRTIVLPDVALAALTRRALEQNGHRETAGATWGNAAGLVFTDEVGRPLRGYNLNAAFGRMLDRLAIPRVPFHALRHSAATVMLQEGVPIRVVAEQLGHSSITLTANTYAAVVPSLLEEASRAVDRALANPQP